MEQRPDGLRLPAKLDRIRGRYIRRGAALAGLVVLVLQENAVTDPRVKRGLDWLADNQDKTTGAWAAWSLNKNRDPQSNIGQFMSDAATSYAVLALDARKASAPESSSIPDSRRTPVTR